MKAGPHATGIYQPPQARKGARARRPSRVPWDPLAGAGFTRRSQDGVIDGGCTATSYRGGESQPLLLPGPPHPGAERPPQTAEP